MRAPELAVAYLLGELDAPGRREADERMRTDEAFRAEVDALAPIVGHLDTLPADGWPVSSTATGTAVAEAPAPPVAESRDPAPAPRRAAPRRGTGRRRRRALTAALAMACLAVGLGAGALLWSGGGSAPSSAPSTASAAVVLRPLAPGTRGTVSLRMPGPRDMVLRARDLRPLPAGEYYELWLMSSPRRLVALASFAPGAGGRAAVRLRLPTDPARFRYFDVSIQRVGGGPAHSAHSVLRAAT